MNTVIRTAKPFDIPTIVEFNLAMAQETEDVKLNIERLKRGVKELFNDPSKGVYYVAEIDNEVVGQLMITYEWSDWRNSNFWWIQSVYVLPDFRRKGVFRELYQYVESFAKQRGDVCGLRLYVEKENQRAQKTYESLGMNLSRYVMMEKEFIAL